MVLKQHVCRDMNTKVFDVCTGVDELMVIGEDDVVLTTSECCQEYLKDLFSDRSYS